MKLINAILIPAALSLAACSGTSQTQKLALVYHAPAKVEMCADKTPSGAVHISPCNALAGDPR